MRLVGEDARDLCLGFGCDPGDAVSAGGEGLTDEVPESGGGRLPPGQALGSHVDGGVVVEIGQGVVHGVGAVVVKGEDYKLVVAPGGPARRVRGQVGGEPVP